MAETAEIQRGNPRVAISSMFFSFGVMGGTWASRIPAIRDRTNIDNGDLGLALLAIPIGVTFSIHTLARINSRFGSGIATRLAIAMSVIALCLPALSIDLLTLVASLFVLGAAWGLLDVSMNTQASILEHQYKRPIMSSFHAFFSLGALMGAAFGAVAAFYDLSPFAHLSLVAVAIAISAALLSSWLLGVEADRKSNESSNNDVRTNNWSIGLALLAAIAFCGSLCEGVAYDWSGVYASDVIGASSAVGAIGLAGYALAMCAVRFVGDKVTTRIGSIRILQICSVIIGVGFSGGLLFSSAVASILAWTLLGLGVSVIVPTAISLAGKMDLLDRSRAIAKIAGAGWIGSVTGPPLVGQLSQYIGLQKALMVPALLGLSVFITSAIWALKNRDLLTDLSTERVDKDSLSVAVD